MAPLPNTPLFAALPVQRRGLAGWRLGEVVLLPHLSQPQTASSGPQGRLIAVLPRFAKLVVRLENPARIACLPAHLCRHQPLQERPTP